ncbi:SDR family NAD(P)-dependent oxidoreductase [Xylanibacillus composti]|uniref:Uncharacterized protein n=1 Tax=Xylanibacillus composti TaxID=1572762 RepID=A0A8J4H4U0_9BACL|nr:SDR family NAD(P)-dependent oxidoreductase [Xylanibacillus composti]MDT9726955.1 SDR family NAD(P)-dependent oxidoreductase [Xylanibacillus composti]GIQ69511.1 hypothetical protein XYCOK13_23350 [Xylanibacillus composti]
MTLSSIKVNLSKFEGQDGKARPGAVDGNSIAIIGIGLKLPQADTPQQLARLLLEGRDAVRPIPVKRKRDIDSYLRSIGKDPSGIRYEEAAYLDAIDKFDYAFFKLSPKEASLLDPNQRLFLQAAWHALEDAGYAGDRLRGSRTGVYLGYGSDADYKRMISEVDPDSAPLSMPGNVRPIIASRLSYLLDLKGPSLAVDTTCSSSLVAVHLACQALRSGECDTALAGGIQLHLVPVREFEVGVESSTSRTRTFDYDADGTGTGEGALVVVLKPLHKALEERDAIYAVIKGSAINQDGSSAGITAPNAAAQAAVLEEAWRRSGVAPDTIQYVEAHGTGTKLGDPIEIEGLQLAFSRYTAKRQFCAVGSIKSNFGHLDNAAGIAGLVKAALSLQHQVLFPTLHFIRPNPNIDFVDSPIYVNDRLSRWEAVEGPRRCGVSSFGISGTNCHVVLEEAPETASQAAREAIGMPDAISGMPLYSRQASATEPASKGEAGGLPDSEPRAELIALSAQTEEALRKLAAGCLGWIKRNRTFSLADLAFTLGTGRGHYAHRLAFVAEDRNQLLEQLDRCLKSSEQRIVSASTASTASTASSSVRYTTYSETGIRAAEEARAKGEADKQSAKQVHPSDITSEAMRLMDEFLASGKRDASVLHRLARLYAAGASLPWERLYHREKRSRLHLPVYPFAENRCWLKFPDAAEKEPSMFHRPIWIEAPLPEQKGDARKDRLLLIKGKQGIGADLLHKLAGSGHAVLECEWDELLNGGEAALGRLWRTIREERISRVIHLACWGNDLQGEPSWTIQLERGLYGLQRWFSAMPEEEIADSGNRQLDLCLVADCAQAVGEGGAQVNPAHAAMFGFAKSIHWEHPSIRVRTVDADCATDAEQLVRELIAGSAVYHAAYREGVRYEARIQSFDPDSFKSEEFTWRTDGVYLITGGLGGIGLALARHMAGQAPVKLALLNRSPKSREKLAQIEALEALGAQIVCCQADVADCEQMQAVVAKLREEHGPIRGVIHAAGIAAGNYLRKLGSGELEAVMRAKEQGTLVLERVLQEDNPDFIVLCSSAITLVGGVGSGPYTAANAFLDAYAARRSASGKRTIAINWPAWDHTGLSEGAVIEEEKELFRLLPPDEAARCFEVALRSGLPQVYVGEWNRTSALFRLGDLLPFRLSADLQRWIEDAVRLPSPRAVKRSKPRGINQVQLKGSTNADYSEIELQVAQAWRTVLGYEELDIHANFFEIGGDSILITNVHAQLDNLYPGVLRVPDLFSQPTIAKLAAYLREQLHAGEPVPSDEDGQKEPLDTRRLKLRSLLQSLSQRELSVDEAVARYRDMEVGL